MGSALRYNGSVRVGIISPNRHTLLVLEPSLKDPKLKLPGGGIEDGETVIEAAIRETWEETSVAILPEEIEHLEVAYKPETGIYIPHFCLARVTQEAFDQFLPYGDENGEPLFVKEFLIDEVGFLPNFLEPHRRFLHYLSGVPA